MPTLLTRSIPRTATQMAAYGACIQLNMPDVGKGACEREMEALKADAAKAREDLAALERRRRAEEEARRRDAPSPAAARRKSRGKESDPKEGPPSEEKVAATAALEAREAVFFQLVDSSHSPPEGLLLL